MPIEREEMQEIVRGYLNPTALILGSHSALDAWQGARDFGLRSLVYTTPARAYIYLKNPMVGKPKENVSEFPDIVTRDLTVTRDIDKLKRSEFKGRDPRNAVLVLQNYSDIVKHVDDLIELEALQIPNRAFSVYVGGDENCSVIENDFPVPIVGSRKLLKVENRGAIEKDYYWFAEKAKIPTPKAFKYKVSEDGITFPEKIDEPMLLKAEHAGRSFEREFIFAADSTHMEEKVRREVKLGNLDKIGLEEGRVEQIVLGPHANFNYFFSPLDAKKSWGDTEKMFAELYCKGDTAKARTCLANQFLSIDERRETILDGLKRLPNDVQEKIKKVPSFEVTAHLSMSLKESLLKDTERFADAFLLATKKYEPPGIIGAWCLQTLITWDKVSKYNLKPVVKLSNTSIRQGGPKTGEDYGLYDVPEGAEPSMHIPVTQDVALRHGGGTNTHMGVGSQYANAKFQRPMSMGDRIALEIKRANAEHLLEEIVT